MLIIKGVPGSPYTRKVLSLLRFRRIPYRYLQQGNGPLPGLPEPKVSLLPVVYLTDQEGECEALVDSTPIIRRLEADYPGRSVIPTDPALRFLDYLIEDYADEWLTKPMFHIRWHYEADAEMAATILPYWGKISAPDDEITVKQRVFRERQVSRLYVVGSNDTTAPVIEASYRRFLTCFDALLTEAPFVMGDRPGAADFALFGQLTQLAQFDPTAVAMTLEDAPRVYAWVSVMEDLSGLEPAESGWRLLTANNLAIKNLLTEMGRTYVPVMLANHQAVMVGASKVSTTVEGQPWQQITFKYQAHCVDWIRQEYGSLEPKPKTRVDELLGDTGCEALLA